LILRILVIENNVEISEAIGFFCSARKDIDCEAINTGQEGLDMIRKENFDLILLDTRKKYRMQREGMGIILSHYY